MKTHHLFYCMLIFTACCVVTWKAESTLLAVIGYITLMILIIFFGKSIIDKPLPGKH